MSDLSNWDTTWYQTFLKNSAQELRLQENIKEEGVRAKSIYLKILGATSDLLSSGSNHTEDNVDWGKYYNSYGHRIASDDNHIQVEMRSIMLFDHKGIKTAQDAILGIIKEECDPSWYNLHCRIKATAALRTIKITLRNKIIRDSAALEDLVASLHNRDLLVSALEDSMRNYLNTNERSSWHTMP